MGALQSGAGREGIGWDCITANMLLFSRQTLFLRLVNVFSGPCYPESLRMFCPEAPVLAFPVAVAGSRAA